MSSSTPPPSHNHEPSKNQEMNKTQNQESPPPAAAEKPNSETKKSTFSSQLYPQKPTWVLPYRIPSLKSLYTIGKKLGQGQFGITFLCTEKSSGIDYACKLISKCKALLLKSSQKESP